MGDVTPNSGYAAADAVVNSRGLSWCVALRGLENQRLLVGRCNGSKPKR